MLPAGEGVQKIWEGISGIGRRIPVESDAVSVCAGGVCVAVSLEGQGDAVRIGLNRYGQQMK